MSDRQTALVLAETRARMEAARAELETIQRRLAAHGSQIEKSQAALIDARALLERWRAFEASWAGNSATLPINLRGSFETLPRSSFCPIAEQKRTATGA